VRCSIRATTRAWPNGHGRGAACRLQQRQAQARAAGRLYGIGVAAIVEPSVSNMGYISTVLTAEQRAKAGPKNGAIASATVGIDLLGGVNVVIASAPAGQGHITVCAQVVADVFGCTPSRWPVNVEFDTAKDAWSVAAGNYSSRFAGAVAGTVHLAASGCATSSRASPRRSSAAPPRPLLSKAARSSTARSRRVPWPSAAWPRARTGHRRCCPKAWNPACARPRSGHRRR
jgi:CO/xanthine dehydrogenase Mo-binding subunit